MNNSLQEFLDLSVKEFYQLTKNYTKTYNLLKVCRTYKYYHFGYYVGKLLENAGEWKYLDELSICAYWVGEYQESYNLCNKILNTCPDSEKERILQNKLFSEAKLKTI